MLNKFKIIFKKSTRSIKDWFFDFCDEIFVLFRNQSYAKKHPNLFAIFSIIEQEQNPQIFAMQKENFDLIKENILGDKEIINHHVLEALRSLVRNNIYEKSSNKIRDKFVKYFFKKTKQLIDENNSYYAPLIKIIVFSLPFLLNYENYTIFRTLIKRKSRNSLKLIKVIFEHYESLDFLLDPNDVLTLLNAAVSFDNKPAFMIIMRFLRKKDQIGLLFTRKSAPLRRKIFDAKAAPKRGFDYVAIFSSYSENNYLENVGDFLTPFFKSSFSSRVKEKEKSRRYQKISLYIDLGKRVGRQNSYINTTIKEFVNQAIIKKDQKFRINRLKKIKKSLFRARKNPNPKVRVRAIFNLTKQHPEEYWMMEFCPYLL